MSPAILSIYIGKLKDCLEEASCACTKLVEVVILLLIYVDDIVLLVRNPCDLDK